MDGQPWSSLSTIRVRLITALAVALLPVLALGGVQSALAFNREDQNLRESLAFAAERSAATARARMESADILLHTLAGGSVGFQCAQRLAQVAERVPGYLNLIRFDSAGRVACAAAGVPADPGRASRDWFRQLQAGDDLVITRAPGAAYAREPAVIAAARAEAPDGSFQGVQAAVISLASLQPRVRDPAIPQSSDVALADSRGDYISQTTPGAFPDLPPDWRARAAEGAYVWYGRDREGERRVYSAAAIVSDDIFVILSAPSPSLFSWARLNPLTGLILPLLTFLLAFLAVSAVAERVVVRWIAYLQRIATLYARGRLSVRPVQAERMPSEIRELAETLEDMADAIVGRDASLRDSLAQKDALMREIHHRVKNNLQVISSLLNMQQRALTDPAARAAMSDTRQRITALALIYRALYQSPDLKRVDLRAFLEELTAQLVAGEMLRGPPVRTELDVEPLVIDPDRLAPLALFAVEAITNAQKHAFAGRGGELTVHFSVSGDEALLEIADDGTAPEEALVASGVGRTLMTAFARQLRGRSELVQNAAGGITARLIFPAPTPESVANSPPQGNQAAA
ncbi:sensor histidine kinase [Phenylobacterium sp.]|jgi:two-component sensor histidine kinase|uniref:sensor histidine kinase PhyK n=1 Tax=Phenylobacterium sp. TaxID=1871053 RepID=UPI002E36A3C1|nr:sensor histidine kinase [Phenylobacterium sp.]HEX2559165.1 sensor histidine kinase [Phenylobacterium sp.]